MCAGYFSYQFFSFLVDQVVLDVLVNRRRKVVGVGHVHVGPPVDSSAIANGVAGGLLLYRGFSETRYTPFGYLFVPKGSTQFSLFHLP
jgi:hypothetical protein